MTTNPADPSRAAVEIPTIVCLCGSTRFKEEFVAANLRETLAGNMVLTIGCDMRTDDELFGSMSPDELERTKDGLDRLHLWKIWQADEVLILNKGGYIGVSTTRELWFARELRRKIRYLEPGNIAGVLAKVSTFAARMHSDNPDPLAKSLLGCMGSKVEPSRAEREKLGRIVRQTWIQYCMETGRTAKLHHMTPYEELGEWDKEVDCRIGEAVYSACAAQSSADANAYTVLTDPHALHLHLLRYPLPRATLLHLLGEVYLERLVTRAVEAMREEACKEVCSWCHEGDVPAMVDGDWRHKTISSYMTCRARRIRAIPLAPIIAAALQSAQGEPAPVAAVLEDAEQSRAEWGKGEKR